MTTKLSIRLSQRVGSALAPQELSAEACIQILREYRLAGTAVATLSSVDSDDKSWNAEPGVVLDIYKIDKQFMRSRLWPTLQVLFSLECAHVTEANGAFSGCIYDWFRPSCCPAVERCTTAQEKTD